MKCYPLNLKLENEKCLVVGGGCVALRKVKSLISYGAKVYVVAKVIEDELMELEKQKMIRIKQRAFIKTDIKGKFLVFAATQDSKVNKAIYNICKKERILVNVADNPNLCSFIVPSVLQRGDFQISICSGGNAPGLSKKIREELEEIFPENFEKLAEEIGKEREKIKTENACEQERAKLIKSILNNKIIKIIDKE